MLQRLTSTLRTKLHPTGPGAMRLELIAALTLFAIGLPEAVGYSAIAHMPIAAGVATMTLPMLAYALVGSSRHLVVGADSATAAILAAGLSSLALPASERYVALCMVSVLFTASILFASRIFRLGFIASFLSRTLLVGFMIGVGISVAVGQLPKMLGLPALHTHGTLAGAWAICTHLGQVSWISLAFAAGALAVLLATKRFEKIPVAFGLIAVAMVATLVFHLKDRGLAVVGAAHFSLPSYALPHLSSSSIGSLLTLAASMAIVILAQSAATSQAYAARYDESYDANADLIGLGVANLAAAALGAFVVSGSLTKTEIADSAGSRSQLGPLFAALFSTVALFTLLGPLAYLPEAVLAAVVFSIALRLMRFADLRQILRLRRDEGIVAIITALAVITLGVQNGIIASAVLCLINHVRRGYEPKNYLLAQEDGAWQPHPVADLTPLRPGIFCYRFEASLYYANVSKFASEVALLSTQPGTAEIICDLSAIADIDYSAGQALNQLTSRLATRSVTLTLTHATEQVTAQLSRFKVTAHDHVRLLTNTKAALANPPSTATTASTATSQS